MLVDGESTPLNHQLLELGAVDFDRGWGTEYSRHPDHWSVSRCDADLRPERLPAAPLRTLDNIAPAFVLANGPAVTPVGQTPTAGLGQGVFTVDATLGSGYAQQWNASVQREVTANTVVEVSYLGSKITNIGIPDSNINQLTEQ